MDEAKLIRVLKSLPAFAKNFLIIHDKAGAERNFEMNRAQLYVHERLEAQLKATGKVRALILKGRQQGVSTYVQARFFQKIITKRGKKAFILTHLADATAAIFEMTKRYSENVDTTLFPSPDKKNDNKLTYEGLGSGYRVGTAGSCKRLQRWPTRKSLRNRPPMVKPMTSMLIGWKLRTARHAIKLSLCRGIGKTSIALMMQVSCQTMRNANGYSNLVRMD